MMKLSPGWEIRFLCGAGGAILFEAFRLVHTGHMPTLPVGLFVLLELVIILFSGLLVAASEGIFYWTIAGFTISGLLWALARSTGIPGF